MANLITPDFKIIFLDFCIHRVIYIQIACHRALRPKLACVGVKVLGAGPQCHSCVARAQPGAAPAAPRACPVALLVSPAGLGTGCWHVLSQLLPAWGQ